MEAEYYDNIDEATKKNTKPRMTLYRYPGVVIEAMKVAPKQGIGSDPSKDTLLFIKVVEGVGMVTITGSNGDKTQIIDPGMALTIPPGVKHTIINVSSRDILRFYVINIRVDVGGASIGSKILSTFGLGSETKDEEKPPFLREMRGEIAFQGEVTDYIRMCMTDKAALARCMVPGHWTQYMKHQSIEDAALIVKFSLTYLEDHPRLFSEVSTSFLDEFKSDIEIVCPPSMSGGVAKAKAAKVRTVAPVFSREEREEIERRTKIENTLDMLKKELSNKIFQLMGGSTGKEKEKVDEVTRRTAYTLKTHRPLSDILNSRQAFLWLLLAKFKGAVSCKSKTDNKYKVEFIEDFIESIRVSDRSIDVQVADLYIPWRELRSAREVPAESQDIEDAFGDFFDACLSIYVSNNGKTAEERLIIVDNMTSRMQNGDIIRDIRQDYERAVAAEARRKNNPKSEELMKRLRGNN